MNEAGTRGTAAAAARDGLLLAFGTLTALRVPHPEAVDRPAARVAMATAALPGVVLGVLAVVVAALSDALNLPPLAGAGLVVGSLALATRGLHLDGLADTADGLAASFDRLRALAVMRTGDAGPAGVTTLVLVLLLQVAGVAAVWDEGGWFALGLAVVISRAMLAVACMSGVPAARTEGLGAVVAGSVPVVWTTAVLVAVGVAGGVGGAAAYGNGWAGPAALVVALVVAAAVIYRAGARLGGITGDVLGAVVETSFAAALLALAGAL